ncbi:MAG: hypothetical protein JW951_01765, partial [Lentisphaerae bacterium]|nr:hypothetical protein [Lentisphaerota bacterium]
VLVITPTEELVASGACERRIREKASSVPLSVSREKTSMDRLWTEHDRNGVPLGGLGTGKVELCQDGGLANASLNNNQDAPIATLPGSFFVARETRTDGGAAVRLLEKGHPALTGVESVVYRGRYPFADVRYEDRALQTRLALEAFAPMVPYEVEDSSVPAACFRFTAWNPGAKSVRLTLGFSWENLIGCGGLGMRPEYGPGSALSVEGKPYWVWNDRSGNDQAACSTSNGAGLRFFRRTPCPYDSSEGEYAVLCAGAPALRTGVTVSYHVETDIAALLAALESRPLEFPRALLDEPGLEGARHPAGVVWAEADIAPGATQTIVFTLGWRFPHARDRYGIDGGVNYAHRFPTALAAADYLLKERERLAAASRTVPDRIEASSLPAWLKEKIINDQFPLTACTWFDGEGRFSVNEAPSGMHGCLGTIDQRTASQGVYTSLFPALDRNELGLFGDFQHANGQISHDLGFGGIDRKSANYNSWPDLVASFILQVHRHVHATGDLEFGRAMAARIPAGVDWAMSLDDDDDGVPDMGPGRANTYDNCDWPGCSSFVASLWIAGMHAAADLMRLTGREDEAERYRRLAARAAETMERRLWNGTFYRNFVCPASARTDGEDCLLPQVAGEWALDLTDLPRGLPEERVRSALREIHARNIVGKGFKAPADEVTPRGDPAWAGMSFLQYAWVYFGALAAYRGLAREAEDCWRQAYAAQWTINKQPWKTRLCAFALNGMFNGLPWYMTNTASWYILDALSGFAYSAPDGWLRIDPHVPESWRAAESGADCLDVPLFGAGFRLGLSFRCDAHGLHIRLDPEAAPAKRWAVRILRTPAPKGVPPVRALVNGSEAAISSADARDSRLAVVLPRPWEMGEPLQVDVEWKSGENA